MSIPFSPPYIDDDVKQEVMHTLDSGWITTGPKVKALEKEVANYCRVEVALGVSSATAGIQLLLHWLGIAPGDEVIVPAYTYCATALAAIHAGATVKMADVNEDFSISLDSVAAHITPKTKAIVLVDYAGWPCDYDAAFRLVNAPGVNKLFTPSGDVQKKLGRIFILADAAHSLGAMYNGRRTGSLADATVFSFHAVKNLTTAEGGMICLSLPAPLSNADAYKVLRLWTLNGQTKDAFSKSQAGSWRYDVVYPGFKMNLPDVLAAIGLAQFRNYKTNMLAQRKRVSEAYNRLLRKHSWALLPPFHKEGCESAYHLYPLRIKGFSEEQRDAAIEYITGHGVAVNVHFIPMPMLTVFRQMGFDMNDYPQSYAMYANEISLPIYPQLTENDIVKVAHCVADAVNNVMVYEG